MTESSRSRNRGIVGAAMLALVAELFTPTPATAAITGTTTRVSVADDGSQGNANSQNPDVSADGRYVVFDSAASNLVVGDTNARPDAFVRDRQTGATTRVSVASDGSEGTPTNSLSHIPKISADGRFVAFQSSAANLVAGDTNNTTDSFVHDRDTGATTRVSVASDGTQADAASTEPAISADGRYVAFSSGARNLGGLNPLSDIFVHDRQTATTTIVSVATSGEPAAGINLRPAISADGRFVAFQSSAANVAVGDTNNANDVFVRDREANTTTLASVATGGGSGNGASETPSISAAVVAFESDASNLVAGDTNMGPDVFVRDLVAGATSRVSVASDGSQRTPSATNDQLPDISDDGRYVSFSSYADLTPSDTNDASDLYVHDRTKARTERVNVATDGTPAAGGSGATTFPNWAVSADGRYIAFGAGATNLVDGDTNGVSDIFLRDRRSVPAVPAVSVGNATVHEGDAGTRGAVFTVSLSAPSTSTVTVDYATADATSAPATPGDDYTSQAGTLSFAPGVTSQTVKVAVAGDIADEANQERFDLRLSNVSGAFVADGAGTATIVDDDPDGRIGLRLAIGDVSVYEGDAGARVAVFNVSLSQPHTSTVSVSYATVKGTATKPGDFTAKSGTLSFATGMTSQQVKVQIGADTVAEGNESLTVTLSDATGGTVFIADGTGTGTIIDND